MNLFFSFYSILTLLFSVLGYNVATPKVDSIVFAKSLETKDTFDTEHFNKTLEAYNGFYNNTYKHVRLKMGEVSMIEQRVSLESDNHNLEVVYDERIQCAGGNRLEMTVQIVDLYFYNKKRTQFEKRKPKDISQDSKRGNNLNNCKKDISDKCELLLQHLASNQ